MKILLTPILLFCFSSAFSQTIDTITKVNAKPELEKFPTRRNFDIRYEQFAPSNYAPDYKGVPQGTGRFSRHYRFKAAVTIPLFTSRNWLINTSVKYKYEAFEFGTFKSIPTATLPVTRNNNEDFQLFTGNLSVTRFSSLFGKMMIYNGNFIADATESEFGRIKGNVSATMILKRTKTTSAAIGFLAFIDRSAPIPVLPVVSFQHDFRNGFALDLFLPQRMMVRKSVFKNGRISLGSELENEQLYFRLNNQQNQNLYDYRQMEIRSGLTYEHDLGNRIIVTLKGGLTNYINARAVRKGEPSGDYEFSTHPEATGYFSLGLSFHPFER